MVFWGTSASRLQGGQIQVPTFVIRLDNSFLSVLLHYIELAFYIGYLDRILILYTTAINGITSDRRRATNSDSPRCEWFLD